MGFGLNLSGPGRPDCCCCIRALQPFAASSTLLPCSSSTLAITWRCDSTTLVSHPLCMFLYACFSRFACSCAHRNCVPELESPSDVLQQQQPRDLPSASGICASLTHATTTCASGSPTCSSQVRFLIPRFLTQHVSFSSARRASNTVCSHWQKHGSCPNKRCPYAASHTARNSPRYAKHMKDAPAPDPVHTAPRPNALEIKVL